MTTSGNGPSGNRHDPPPGWYPDPQSPSLRWWDGNEWSDSVVPVPQTPPPQQPSQVPPPIVPHGPRPTAPFSQEGQASPRGGGSPTAAALREHWRRLLLDVVLLVLCTFWLVATFTNLGEILGGSPDRADYVRVVVLPLLALGAAYWLWRRARFYVDRHPDGEDAGTKVRDRLLGVWLIGAVVLAVTLGIEAANREPLLSGGELQSLLRSNLGAADGSSARTNTIACPASRDFGDGDVARCTVKTSGDAIEVLVVTVFREGDDWRLGIDVE